MDILTTFFYIAVMVAVLFGAYFTTKFLTGKSKRMMKSRYLNLLDRMPLGKDKNVVLIEVGDKNILLGVTNQNISALGEISAETLKSAKEQMGNKPHKGFAENLRDFLSGARNAQENLRKARMQAKHGYSGDDMLGKMDDAVRSRMDRMKGGDEQ